MVTGTIGNTHGVNNEISPVLAASQMKPELIYLLAMRIATSSLSVRGGRHILSLQT
jgi:hypothetical protein